MKKYVALLLSLVIISIVFFIIDFDEFYDSLESFPLAAIVSVFILFLINSFVVIFRYWRVLRHFGYFVDFASVVKASVSGNIASLLMVPLVGQVAGRQMILNKAGVTAAENAAIAAYERFVVGSLSGLLALLGGAFILSSRIEEYINSLPFLEISLIVVASLVIFLRFLIGVRERLILRRLLSFKSFVNAAEVYLVTVFSSFLVLSCFYLLLDFVLPEVDYLTVLSAAAIVSFLAGLPVSFGGWGLREVSSIYFVSFLGGTAAGALAASVLLGLISTSAVLVLFPLLFLQDKNAGCISQSVSEKASAALNLEDAAVWCLTLMVGVLVFFQLHVQFGDGHLNINLADPFAVLIFSIVILNSVLKRELPKWNVPWFNGCLLFISLAYAYSYFVGVFSFGNTGWASGKLIGWVVILGYLFAGYLVVRHFQRSGFLRLSQLMLVTITIILLVNIVMWILHVNNIVVFANFHYILEAYSGNRNALAFQVLVVFCLTLSFSPIYIRLAGGGGRTSLLTLSLSIMVAAVLITASRSAMGTLFVVLAVAFVFGMVRRIYVFKVACFGVFLFSGSHVGAFAALPISSESSDLARWALIVESFNMWIENPIFGAGLGAFYYNSFDLIGFSVVVHNTALWVLAEFGLVGFLIFIVPFLLIFKYAVIGCNERFVSNALILLLLVFSLMSLFHEVFYQRTFWLALGGLISFSGARGMPSNIRLLKKVDL